MHFPTSEEAAYPLGLCESVAQAIMEKHAKQQAQGHIEELTFTEVFAGKLAGFPTAVARVLAASGFKHSSCAAGPASAHQKG